MFAAYASVAISFGPLLWILIVKVRVTGVAYRLYPVALRSLRRTWLPTGLTGFRGLLLRLVRHVEVLACRTAEVEAQSPVLLLHLDTDHVPVRLERASR